jgi:TMEM175 potassium channel family protein
MGKSRLEAFSDGVLAIIITIMVLELKVPHGSDFDALKPILPVFLSYVLSFIYVGIYWNNHHHLIKAAPRVNGAIMWANLHLLFWLSLFPFATGWMGENYASPARTFTSLPAATYGAVLLFAAIAYYILQRLIIAEAGHDSKLAASFGRDWKGKLSPVLYAVGIALAFFRPWAAGLIYVLVALIWLIPDRRIERVVDDRGPSQGD